MNTSVSPQLCSSSAYLVLGPPTVSLTNCTHRVDVYQRPWSFMMALCCRKKGTWSWERCWAAWASTFLTFTRVKNRSPPKEIKWQHSFSHLYCTEITAAVHDAQDMRDTGLLMRRQSQGRQTLISVFNHDISTLTWPDITAQLFQCFVPRADAIMF